MKTRQTVERRESSVESQPNAAVRVLCLRPSSLVSRLAFTLVELLVVIGIITVIAALLFPLARTVKRQAFIHNAQAQMAQLETAIARYHSVYGFYPPSNAGTGKNLECALTNQLYYELEGIAQTNVGGTEYYATLDHSTDIKVADVNTTFGVSGFMNCIKPGADESSVPAQNFLPDLTTNQIAQVTNKDLHLSFIALVTPVGGPDSGYNPLGQDNLDVNPWRYNSSNPTNNPGSYDLWIQLAIGGDTNLICNWNNRVQINTSLP